MNSKFNLGELVQRDAFTDCFGKHHADIPNLLITKVTLTTGVGIEPYYRVVAESLSDRSYYEGAERFFSPMF